MDEESFAARIQVPANHYEDGYDTALRWSSYWIQIEQALTMPEGPMLEVGVGNGVVSDYLRKVGKRKVITVDIDPDLGPDIVSDIQHLPFDDQEFSCVMACEVLEHLPFDATCNALREMRRVAGAAIISVPATDQIGQLRIDFRFRRLQFQTQVPFPRVIPRTTPNTGDEHHWELGMKDYPHSRFKEAIARVGWEIVDSFRNPMHQYHYFMILRAK